MNDQTHSATGRQSARTIWICPMHVEVQQAGPGSCTKCGMHLAPDAEAANVGHDHHEDESRVHSLAKGAGYGIVSDGSIGPVYTCDACDSA